jgi:hypothetical protein
MQERSLSVQNCQLYDLKDWHASAQDIQNLIESSVVGLFPVLSFCSVVRRVRGKVPYYFK